MYFKFFKLHSRNKRSTGSRRRFIQSFLIIKRNHSPVKDRRFSSGDKAIL